MLRISAATVACICLALSVPQAYAQDSTNAAAAPETLPALTVLDLALAKGELERALVELKQSGDLTESGYTKLLADIEEIEGKLRAENPEWFSDNTVRNTQSTAGYDQTYRSSNAYGSAARAIAPAEFPGLGTLVIQLGNDGAVSVEGEGVPAERLELIREHLEAGKVQLKEGVSIDTTGEGTTITIQTGPKVMRLGSLQGLEGLEALGGLENLRVLELESLEGLGGLENLKVLELDALKNFEGLTPEQQAKIEEGRAQVLKLREDGTLGKLRALQLDEERIAKLRGLAEQLRSSTDDAEREALAAQLRELALPLKELAPLAEDVESDEAATAER